MNEPAPLAHDLPEAALRLLARAAHHHETPCGEGRMVWHEWDDSGGRGEPLVLLHGGSGSWTHWLRNIEALAATGRRVLVPDLPGFGDSAVPPHGRDADALPGPLAEGLRRLLGARGCDVVGFSFGGLAAGLMAQAHPEAVRRLVIVGAPGLGLRSERLPLSSWRHLADVNERDAVHRHNLQVLMLHEPAAIDDLAVALQAANVPRDRMRGRHLAMTDILARTLPQLTCRIDAIYGAQDALYRDRLPELTGLLALMHNFGEIRLVPGAGHWVQYEKAADFHRELLHLLAPQSW